ncbi:MAG: CoA pyrophosphatase [Roseiflexaceae bacterium]
MSAHDWPSGPQGWLDLVRAGLALHEPIPREELLLVRDQSGRSMRPVAPPEGVVARLGAVLILLYPDGPDLRLPLTVRSETLPNHRGEVSLPGGATDPEDNGPEATALRECWEELGIPPEGIAVLGSLPPIYIPPSNFRITPVVGWSAAPPIIQFNTHEVSALLTVTLRELVDPALVVVEEWQLRGTPTLVPFFAIAGHKVWGATALMLSELVARLRRAQAW